MTQSSDNLKDLYREFATIDGYFYVTEEGVFRVDTAHTSIVQYCNYENNSGTYECNDYFQLAICSVIHLLKNYKKYKLEDDKLAEYVILWLSYKLNTVKDKCDMNLNNFYTKHIEKNEYYNNIINGDDTTTYKNIIDKIKELMDIKEISKFNDPFSILFYLYNAFHDERVNCTTNLKLANNFVQNVETLNNDSNNIKDSSFSQILSTLSDDYNNLKNKYGNKCSNIPSIPELTPKNKPVESSAKGGEQISLQTPENTSSSSSILKTVIPVLSTFFVISLFLGVAYKYSLFGFGKRSQKRYLRENIKK
ncbi:CIR protein [Plasmodium chabaudi adami]|uniref:CIR protein n=1 Tax=Plasmodium chabaudi adami TaxID=5826 RepID=A0A1C6WRG4_PLACE|nr:CIR protein [Plasmodium chabaudi adami]